MSFCIIWLNNGYESKSICDKGQQTKGADHILYTRVSSLRFLKFTIHNKKGKL